MGVLYLIELSGGGCHPVEKRVVLLPHDFRYPPRISIADARLSAKGGVVGQVITPCAPLRFFVVLPAFVTAIVVLDDGL